LCYSLVIHVYNRLITYAMNLRIPPILLMSGHTSLFTCFLRNHRRDMIITFFFHSILHTHLFICFLFMRERGEGGIKGERG